MVALRPLPAFCGDKLVPHTTEQSPFSLHSNYADPEYEDQERRAVSQICRKVEESAKPDHAPKKRLPNHDENQAFTRAAEICPDRAVPPDITRKPMTSGLR